MIELYRDDGIENGNYYTRVYVRVIRLYRVNSKFEALSTRMLDSHRHTLQNTLKSHVKTLHRGFFPETVMGDAKP